jgi:5'-nucleotidase
MGVTETDRTRRWWSGRRRTALIATAVLLVGGSVTSAAAQAPAARVAAAPETLRILVTNDDGVAAPGLGVLVNVLQSMANVEVTVIAPATNQSGTGESFTAGNLTVAPATTWNGGDPATAVSGKPADTVLYGVLSALPQRPQLIVSGVNQGQNLGTITDISGTVGAARTANRLGIPAIAVSAGLGAQPNYLGAALTARAFIELFRSSYTSGDVRPQTLNINAPTCPSGSTRGIVGVPLGQPSKVTGYTLQSGTTGNGVFTPTVVTQNAVATANCTSTLTNPKDDIEAFNNGFITVTVLNPDLGDR